MSILYLSYDGLTDPLGQSQIIPYLEGLVEKEHEITVVSFEKVEKRGQVSGISGQVPGLGTKVRFEDHPSLQAGPLPTGQAGSLKSFTGRFFSTRSSFVRHTSEEGNELKWLPLKYHKYPPVLSTLYDIWRLKSKASRIVKSGNIDIVHCRSYITSLVGIWLKRKYGLKFIFDMRGFWADERVEGGLWNLKNPVYRWIYRYFKRKERQFIMGADTIVTLTEMAKKEIEEQKTKDKRQKTYKSQKSKSKIWVIPTCVDTGLFDPVKVDMEKQEELRDSLRIEKDDFILLYLGSLGTWYMLDEMMDFFIELKKARRNSKFLFVTKDELVVNSWLMAFGRETGSKAGRGGVDNEWKGFNESIIITQAEREEVPLYINLCNASIFFIKPTFSKKASSATKMGEVMAMGKPVITNSGWGDVEEIIDHGKDGLLLEDFSEEVLKKSIFELDSLLKTPVEDIRGKAIKLLSLEKGVEKYHGIYETLKSETLKP